MTAKKRATPAIWNDPDDAPQLTAEFFQSADLYKGDKVQARGRPKAAFTKEPVKQRLDASRRGTAQVRRRHHQNILSVRGEGLLGQASD